jgi:protein SERAC1
VSFFPFIGKPVAQEATIDKYSAALYQNLASFRKTTNTPSDRPIIYVAHSLGGLVVANALSRPYSADKTAKKLTNNAVGIIFLGTPFAGSDKAP